MSSSSGYSAKLSRGWRSVDGADGYFEYDMKLPHDGKAYLAVLFHERGCENGFRIFAEGEEIAPATLPDAQRSGASYTYYEIPTDIRSNKEKITVKFTRRGADERASAVLEARITTKIVT